MYNMVMLVTSDRFLNMPVMSLQTGSEIGRTAQEIIDPRNLSVVAYEIKGKTLDQHPSLLRIADVREIGPLGMIVDSSDELVSPSDIISLKQIYEINFSLANKSVIDEKKRKIGHVIGYTLTADNFIIQQLRVRRPLLRSFGDTELLIHRSQIVKVTDDLIIVKTPEIRHKEPAVQPLNVPQNFENPFRRTQQKEAIDQPSGRI